MRAYAVDVCPCEDVYIGTSIRVTGIPASDRSRAHWIPETPPPMIETVMPFPKKIYY